MNCKCLGSACCRFLALLPILAFFALVAGCGGAGAKGKMSGKVLYSGKPVTGGSVIFRPDAPSENTVVTQIDANGNYTVSLPLGPVKIAVDNKDLRPVEAELKKQPRPNFPKGAVVGPDKPDPRVNPQKPPGTYVKIPEKYCEVETSGLNYTVKSGSQTFDIKLE